MLVRAGLRASADGRFHWRAFARPFNLGRQGLATLAAPLGQQLNNPGKGFLNVHAPRENDYLQHQQLRYRRHDRSSAFSKPRPRTRKQQKAYNRRMKKISDEKAKHNRPGSRAGPLRQERKERWQQLLDYGKESDELLPAVEQEYGLHDFMVEELIGNTAYLTSQPTPEPLYLGHMHKEFYQKIAKQMESYRIGAKEASTDKEILNVSLTSLPSDKDISNVIRAYRDNHGTRRRPVGIAMALQHVLKDLGVPTVAFGEHTYTSLLTCCRTPKEARRIFKLMEQLRHPISSFSWSILVDVHARGGDFAGCANVIKEMASEGVAPTLAAYTSLLAACYKICNDGRIPHSVRVEAFKVGWSHWQELRIVGIEPDVMCYGAMIRLCAARGQPERAINLLEEMKRFDIKPTTLCFSSALKAVARSHEISIRFEGGWSRKQLRRESTAAHHGKLAREIVIMAENAEVVQDDGFVAALMLCAAAAGDSASAKAIFLAAEVRRMEQLRTIGPGSAADRLRDGVNTQTGLDGVSSPSSMHHREQEVLNSLGGEGNVDNALVSLPSHASVSIEGWHENQDINSQFPVRAYAEREYGKDTRTLSAMLRACAQSMNSNGIGTIWAGKENQGFLCENSQRLITTRWEPRMTSNSTPGESSTKIGIGALKRYDGYEDDADDRRKGTRKKFRGMYIDEDPMTLAEMDGSLDGDLEDEDLGAGDFEGIVGEDQGVASLDSYFEEDEEDTQSYDPEMMMQEVAMTESEIDTELDEDFPINFNVADHLSPGDDLAAWDQVEGTGEDLSIPNGQGDQRIFGNSSVVPTVDDVSAPVAANNSTVDSLLAGYSDREMHKIEQLKLALPGLPMRRIVKIMNVFNSNLGTPSILSLVPVLRETMPDYLSLPYLKSVNNANAEFVLQKAIENRVVDRPLLDTMLQVKSASGSLDGAVGFYEEQYRKHKMKPNEYADRMIVQMLVANNRLSRAFTVKQRVETSGRNLDLASYGCIIDHYARRSQVGSALMLVKECISIHGAPPSEKYLERLRVGCRQMNIESEARLEDMIGQDPTQWLKYGEAFLKREQSKSGRRDVQLVMNRLL